MHSKLRELEKQLDLKIMHLKHEFDKDSVEIPFTDGLQQFLELLESEHIGIGNKKWMALSNVPHDMVMYNLWEKGATMNNHKHPDKTEYIFVIKGRLSITTTSGVHIIVEPDHPEQEIRDYLHWFKIPAGEAHMVLAPEETQFIVKFVDAGKNPDPLNEIPAVSI